MDSYTNDIEKLRTLLPMPISSQFNPRIGIHRIKINNLHIKEINSKKLRSSSAMFFADKRNFCVTDNNIHYSHIKILRPPLFNEFKAFVKPLPFASTSTCFSSYDFAPLHMLDLFSLDDVLTQMASINEFIQNNYGILIDSTESKIKTIEIAAEFTAGAPLSQYSRVFSLFNQLNHIKTCNKIDLTRHEGDTNRWQSCIFTKPSYEIYIYDKSRELYEKHNILLSENIIKFELRIKDDYLYKLPFIGTSVMDTNEAQLKAYFITVIRNNFLKPLEKWQSTYMKNLNTLVSTYRKDYKRWCTELFKKCLSEESKGNIILLDYQDIMLCPCIATLPTATKRRILSTLEQQAEGTVFRQNTNKKIHDILAGLNTAFDGSSIVNLRSNRSLGKIIL